MSETDCFTHSFFVPNCNKKIHNEKMFENTAILLDVEKNGWVY